jgi:hypothetical protein
MKLFLLILVINLYLMGDIFLDLIENVLLTHFLCISSHALTFVHILFFVLLFIIFYCYDIYVIDLSPFPIPHKIN